MGAISNVSYSGNRLYYSTTKGCLVTVANLMIDTPEQQKRFAEKPELYLKYSKMIESELNKRFKFILNGTSDAIEAKEVSIATSTLQ